jgi:flagellar biosynthesis/type III secretory pathway protein FliH
MILFIILGTILLIVIPLYFFAKKENEALDKSYSRGWNEGYRIGFEEGTSKEYKDGFTKGWDYGYDKAKNEYQSNYY